MDINKQIKYWISSAETDLDSAKLLIDNMKILHGLFFCHLVIEKAIKAHIVKEMSEVPPKSHNLMFLIEKSNLEIDTEQDIFFGILMKYQLEGRYPDYNPKVPSKEKALQYFLKTEEIFIWLKNKL